MRWLKVILRIVRYGIYAAIALAIGAIAVLTLTERGRETLAGLISDFASSPGQVVRISGIDGIWSGKLRLKSLVLEDEDGAWMVARDVAIDWSPFALLRKTFQADLVSAERIEVARTPKPASKPKEQQGSFSLPVSLDVKRIDLPDRARPGAGRRRGLGRGERLGAGRQVSTAYRVKAKCGPQRRASGVHRRVHRLFAVRQCDQRRHTRVRAAGRHHCQPASVARRTAG